MDERGIEDAIVMNQKTFKSLTSETRTEILKLLKKRNYTLSEIADALKISKTTAKEHLDILMEGKLIEQVPSTNIWKYYTLTKDGRKLVGEEGPKRVVILIATCIFGILISLYGIYGLTEKGMVPQGEGERVFAGDALVKTAEAASHQEVETAASITAKNDFSLVFILLGLLIVAASLLLLMRGRKERSIL